MFERMRKYGLKLNPLKCAFCVSIGEFLGFIVHEKGIEVDKNKAKTIIESSPPKNLKQLQLLLGMINFLRSFISNLARKTYIFFSLLLLKKEFDLWWYHIN